MCGYCYEGIRNKIDKLACLYMPFVDRFKYVVEMGDMVKQNASLHIQNFTEVNYSGYFPGVFFRY